MFGKEPRAVAENIRYMIEDSGYNSFLDRLATAIEMGEGYVVITLDPDGLKITPLITQNTDQTIALRSRARELARLQWELGAGRFVATVSEGLEAQLPSSLIPSDPAPANHSNAF